VQTSGSQLAATFGTRFTEALAFAPLPDSTLALLAEPAQVLRTRIPLVRDDGDLTVHTAWRLRMADALGPTKGGVRFHPAVDEPSLAILAARILVKCAVNDLPHGGAAGGVAVDPKALSTRELEALSRGYVNAVADLVGADRDILSPDLGTDARVMAWMADQLNLLRRTLEPGAVNGKLPGRGGIPGRHGATAAGAWTVLHAVLEEHDLDPRGLTCAVQGLGAAGGTLATRLVEHGVRVVAVSDSSGGWYRREGLDAGRLIEAKARGQALATLEPGGASPIRPTEALEAPADLVIAAALGGQITAANAGRLSCRLVVEIANAAVSSDAEPILGESGITVVPDVVVNAGGITVSHFEWAQSRQGLRWSADDVSERLEQRMRATARAMLTVAHEAKVALPTAAQILALQRLRAAYA
jgi:glutamate dehydrogenase (NADP+)